MAHDNMRSVSLEVPKYLYHGTTLKVVNRCWTEGLQPRGERKSNWTQFPSRSDCVYLTSHLAGYFAWCACQKGDWPAVLEIDTSLLDIERLLPDEDFVEQVTRRNESMRERTGEIRDNLHQLKMVFQFEPGGKTYHPVEASLHCLGTCAYSGTIPPKAIRRVIQLPGTKHPLTKMILKSKPQVGWFVRNRSHADRAQRWMVAGGLPEVRRAA